MLFMQVGLGFAALGGSQEVVASTDAAAEIAGLNYLTMRVHEMRATGDVDRVCRRLSSGVNSAAMPPRTRAHWEKLFELSNQCIAKLEEADWNEQRSASARRQAEEDHEAELLLKGTASLIRSSMTPLFFDLMSGTDAKPAEAATYAKTTRSVLGQLKEQLAAISRAIEVDKNAAARTPELQDRCIDEEECDELFRLFRALTTQEADDIPASIRRYVRATPADPRGHYLLGLLGSSELAGKEFQQALELIPPFVKRDEVASDAALRLGFFEAERQLQDLANAAPDRVESWLARAERFAVSIDTMPLELALAVLQRDRGAVTERLKEFDSRLDDAVADPVSMIWTLRAHAFVSDGSDEFVARASPLIDAYVAARYGEVFEALLAAFAPEELDELLSVPDPIEAGARDDPLVGRFAGDLAFRALFPRSVKITVRALELDRRDDRDSSESGGAPELYVEIETTGFGAFSTRDRMSQDRHRAVFGQPAPSTTLWLRPGDRVTMSLVDADAFSDDTLFRWSRTIRELLEGKRFEPTSHGSGVECEVEVR